MDFTEIPEDDEEEKFEPSPKKRTGCLLGLFRLFLVLLIPLFVLVALLPTLLSSSPGRAWALSKINAAISPAQLAVDQWSLGWLHALTLDQVVFDDPAHGLHVQSEQVITDRGLLRLFPIGILNLGKITLKNPDASVSLIPQAEPPAPQKKTEKEEKKGGFFFLPVADAAAVLNIENGHVTATGKAPLPFEVKQLNGSVALESYRKPIGVQLQMQVGGGTLTVEGSVQSIRDLLKDEAFDNPQQLTLKMVGVDLTAFCPLIEHASGTPWIYSGTAEGALTVVVSAPDDFKVNGGVLVNGLSVAAENHRPSPKGDLALMTDLSYATNVVSVNKFDLSSPWLRIDASGALHTAKKGAAPIGAITAQASSDLAAVVRDFGPVLGLSKGFAMQRGRLQANVSLVGSEKAMRVDANLTTADLAMTLDGEPLELRPSPSLVFKGTFPYVGWPEIESFHLKTSFADVYGSGRLDAAVVKGKLDFTLFSRDFKRMLKDAPPMVGSAYLDMSTTREGERVALHTFFKLSDLALELKPGQCTVVPQGTLKAEGYLPMSNGKPEGEIQDATFSLTLENGNVAGKWKKLTFPAGDRPLVLRGFEFTSGMELGDVRRLLGGFIPAPAQRRMSEWRGRVLANATAEAAGGTVKARLNAAGQELVAGVPDGGVWRIPDIRLESAISRGTAQEGLKIETTATGCGTLERGGATVFAEKGARLAADATLAPDGESVTFSKFDLTTSLGDIHAKANATELSTRCVLNADGQAAVDVDAVSQLAVPQGLVPFKATGCKPRDFHFQGPVAGGAATLFAEGEFTGAVFVESIEGLGLTAGDADVHLKLSKGHLQMTYEPALNGGRLRWLPDLSMERAEPVLTFPPKTRLLENVTITEGMVDTLLVNVNPLFKSSKVLSGTVTVDLKNCRLASGEQLGQGVSSEMDVAFKDLQLEMGPSLRDLLTTVKVKDKVYSAKLLTVHVTVGDGRIAVSPVTLTIDRQPLTFSGWVTFDQHIQYLIEIPLTDRLLGGKSGKSIRGTTIKIPVTGTVSDPQLDTRAIRNMVGSFVKSAAGEHAAEKVNSFLEKLQQELQK